MTPRGLLTTIGATALGVGIVVGGAAGMPSTRAQDATPSAQPGDEERADQSAPVSIVPAPGTAII